MKVMLKQGETLSIGCEDSEEDVIIIEYTQTELKITATLPDTQGREGELYNEQFGL